MIDRIYEVIADKTLSFGCKVIVCRWFDDNWKTPFEPLLQEVKLIISDWDCWINTSKQYPIAKCVTRRGEFENIIWHPVMIWDVLDWINREKESLRYYCKENIRRWINDILDKREHKRLPIDEQGEDCITFIHNLIKEASLK